MGWEKTKDDLLKMMKVNHNIFGEEILQIESAKEEWLINYFEKRLANILHWEILGRSQYGYIEADGRGVKSSGLKKKGFGLKIEQCVKIFEYIYGRVTFDRHGNIGLHWTDSVVVINYIQDGYKLSESGYEFIRSAEDHGNCHEYN